MTDHTTPRTMVWLAADYRHAFSCRCYACLYLYTPPETEPEQLGTSAGQLVQGNVSGTNGVQK